MVSLTGRAVRSKGMVASSGWAGEKHASGWFPKHLPAAQVGGVRTATESGEHSAASYVTPHRSWSGDLSPQEGEHACQEANTYAPVLLSSGSRHVHASSTPFSCGSSRTAKSTRPVSPCSLVTSTDAACKHEAHSSPACPGCADIAERHVLPLHTPEVFEQQLAVASWNPWSPGAALHVAGYA